MKTEEARAFWASKAPSEILALRATAPDVAGPWKRIGDGGGPFVAPLEGDGVFARATANGEYIAEIHVRHRHAPDVAYLKVRIYHGPGYQWVRSLEEAKTMADEALRANGWLLVEEET